MTTGAARGAALVTGCSTGIGRAAAIALHDAGFAVTATARQPGTLADLESRGMRIAAVDVTDERSMSDAVREVEGAHGHVAVLVNNAGYAVQGPVEETPVGTVRDQFETNVVGLVRMTQLVLPAMREARDGRIINIGSMGGRFTFPGGAFYHASKHAVEAVSDALRLEVAPFGVGVCLVQPGPVRSAFAGTAMSGIDEGGGAYAQFRRDLAASYHRAYDGAATRLDITAEDVADVVVRAATSQHPRARYAVGLTAKAMITTRRVVPDVAWDAFMRRIWPTPRG